MARKYSATLFALAVISSAYCWENLPNLPAGKRAQYFVVVDNEGYKYGYDTGEGQFAKQSGDTHNQVDGHFYYKDAAGKDVDVKYTAGVQGYVPEGLDKLLPQPDFSSSPVQPYSYPAPVSYSSVSSDDQSNSGDASYSFNIDTDSYKRQESSDVSGNVKGRYSYTNNAGQHDLSYIAGSNTGFVATSGSLSVANGLGNVAKSSENYYPSSQSSYVGPPAKLEVTGPSQDGSYSFEYSTDDHSRQESSDTSGNVQGRYFYKNSAGNHDLSYVAGSDTGFQLTGGSLSVPNGLSGQVAPSSYSVSAAQPAFAKSFEPAVGTFKSNEDGSYAFDYSTNDQSREENSDSHGNVKGRYSFKNEAGNHDLSYVAGSETGFQATGGSLATSNGLTGSSAPSSAAYYRTNTQADSSSDDSQDDQANTGDASYSFTIDTDEYKRKESSDAHGNVKGRYSYINKAGSHDLSYVAGSDTGFLPTGGSLSLPSVAADTPISTAIRTTPVAYSSETDDQSNTGDASYTINIDTDEYKRHESSDSQGNVKGSYSYHNTAGSHDLSYNAGSGVGFQITGGSLAQPNGLGGKAVPSQAFASTKYAPAIPSSNTDQSADGSYSFNFDTDEYNRRESSDAQGNVKGRYSYKNDAGSHDLSFVAGSETGFQVTGGSLAQPNGLEGKSAPLVHSPSVTGQYLPPTAHSSSSIDDEASSGDASYSFTINTPEYKRTENSDPQGNVKGSYSYTNVAGSHDLSYVAGAETGFVASGGSLSGPNGDVKSAAPPVASTGYLPPQARAKSTSSPTAHLNLPYREDKFDNVVVKSYYPVHVKQGYIFQTL